jgi:hypothetical protein
MLQQRLPVDVDAEAEGRLFKVCVNLRLHCSVPRKGPSSDCRCHASAAYKIDVSMIGKWYGFSGKPGPSGAAVCLSGRAKLTSLVAAQTCG